MSALLTFWIVALGPMLAAFHDGSDAGDGATDTSTPEPDEPATPGSTLLGDDTVDDSLIGTLFNDTISGLGGSDTLNGLDGDDSIDGGAGDDELLGRDGNDVLLGGAGNDNLNGNAGQDSLDGGAGDDRVDAGEGDDSVFGGAGADDVRGSAGNDTLYGGDATTPIDGAADTLTAGAGDDVLFLSDADTGAGGDGSDRFTLSEGETGAITISDFNETDDLLVVEQAVGSAITVSSQTPTADGLLITFDSGATVLLEGVNAPIAASAIAFVDASDGDGAGGETVGDPEDMGEDTGTVDPDPDPDMDSGEDDTVPGDDPTVTNVTGTDGEETVLPPGPGQSLSADLQGGDDVATGDALNDTLIGGAGADQLSGAAGDDLLLSTSTDAAAASDSDVDSLDGGLGDDTLVLGNADEAVGGEGADVFLLRQDVNDTVTVGDFDVSQDMLVIEASTPSDVTILGQTPVMNGLVVSFSSGAAVLLEGLTQPIDPGLIVVQAPGTTTTA